MSNVILFINGKNARKTWGILTTGNTLSALLSFSPMKENPIFTSRLEHGSRIDTSNPKVAQRELNLEIQLIAENVEQFYQRRASFESELQKGEFTLSTSDNPTVIYHLIYNSCQQFTQFRRGIATFSLKCTEPNPMNR